ncbi:protein-L-isoaspartate(D-aspartate) O-methyltransferase [Candidatus Poribacteria bacterium]|nr:protein-L-isoaspartate(D-aspartate) O-methyltransferase [Candidatus Poribacteria bacterium]MYF55069.1 protein-L-isoaspartate(D-aspartate) O-methyltransferase [Candidatus Poribacteria bacterium]
MIPADGFTNVRQKMVRNQIEKRGIENPDILAAMRKVQRHLFVAPEYRKWAYDDKPLPIDKGQTISQPYIVALMTELLELRANSKVLEIGTGCGYQTAVLAELAREVYSVEIIAELSKRAEARLKTLNYHNIHFKKGNGYYGWIEHAPYDCVLVAAAPKRTPHRLTQQLAEGGRMVVPVGTDLQDLFLLKKSAGKVNTTKITGVSFVPMTGKP